MIVHDRREIDKVSTYLANLVVVCSTAVGILLIISNNYRCGSGCSCIE